MSKKPQDFYLMQEEHHKGVLKNKEGVLHSETWLKKDTVDYWRHKRMRDALLPIIHYYPKSFWLTVGDGRYGTDANYLLDKGLKVHASDIQEDLLKIASKKKFIKEYSKQNAESLTFSDNEFDFVYCKESYHHFPRPAVALYEMLRVARIGIIVQEPKDKFYFENLMQHISYFFLKFLRIILKKNNSTHSFEFSGNYVYSLSPREIQKFALGLHYKCIAYKTQQDYYEKGVEFEKAEKTSKLFKKVKFRINFLELLYKLNMKSGGILTGIILKEVPEENLIEKLRKDGFKVEILPSNPYLNSEK